MHRIDSPGNVLGTFSAGNPQIGQRATQLSADWLNAVQEEIATVIEQSGIDLSKPENNQLYLAIVELIASSGGGGGGGDGVPITRQVNTSGLLSGGGTLANDLNLAVLKASSAEVLAGTLDTKAITPLALAGAAVKSLGGIGYIKRVDGMIEMWGTGVAVANSTTVITLPTSFPNACLWAGVEGGQQVADTSDNNPFVSGRGTGSISIFSSRDSAQNINWFALGY